MCGCHGRGSDHRRALPAVESPTCARVADARKGGGLYIGAKYKYATFQSDKDHIF